MVVEKPLRQCYAVAIGSLLQSGCTQCTKLSFISRNSLRGLETGIKMQCHRQRQVDKEEWQNKQQKQKFSNSLES